MRVSAKIASFALLSILSLVPYSVKAAPLSERQLTRKIVAGIPKVYGFDVIQREAEKLGVRVWIFGGAASSYAAYARDAKADSSFNPLDIFKIDQDIDVVVDGPPEAARQLQAKLNSEVPLPLPKGSDRWEVRLLKSDLGRPGETGGRERLLGNPDFLNQNSDSASNALIEITAPPQGESRVLDIRAKDLRPNEFLRDISENRISFYESASHASTARAVEGTNPEILSAMRTLYKSLRGGARIPDADRAKIAAIVARFRPQSIPKNGYLRNRFEDIGKKLFLQVQDLEAAHALLDEVGLLPKLVHAGEVGQVGSVSWFANREPLRSMPISKNAGRGRTARELGIEYLTHTVKGGDEILESVSANPQGKPNFYISREAPWFGGRYAGEVAGFGDGVYTLDGESSAWGRTGETLLLKINGDAVLGRDFERDLGGKIVRLLNREAATVVPVDFDRVASEFIKNRGIVNEKLDPEDARLLGFQQDRLKLRIAHKVLPWVKTEIRKLAKKRNIKWRELRGLLRLLSPGVQFSVLDLAVYQRLLKFVHEPLDETDRREIIKLLESIQPEKMKELEAQARKAGTSVPDLVRNSVLDARMSQSRMVAYYYGLPAESKKPLFSSVREFVEIVPNTSHRGEFSRIWNIENQDGRLTRQPGFRKELTHELRTDSVNSIMSAEQRFAAIVATLDRESIAVLADHVRSGKLSHQQTYLVIREVVSKPGLVKLLPVPARKTLIESFKDILVNGEKAPIYRLSDIVDILPNLPGWEKDLDLTNKMLDYADSGRDQRRSLREQDVIAVRRSIFRDHVSAHPEILDDPRFSRILNDRNFGKLSSGKYDSLLLLKRSPFKEQAWGKRLIEEAIETLHRPESWEFRKFNGELLDREYWTRVTTDILRLMDDPYWASQKDAGRWIERLKGISYGEPYSEILDEKFRAVSAAGLTKSAIAPPSALAAPVAAPDRQCSQLYGSIFNFWFGAR